jgi:alcohol dehydrogenase
MSPLKAGKQRAHLRDLLEARWDIPGLLGALGEYLGQQICMGSGSVSKLGRIMSQQGLKKPLLVADPGVIAGGHLEFMVQSLKATVDSVRVFTDVSENPTDRSIRRGADKLKLEEFDSIIGFGGGSAMDTAKGLNFLVTNGGQMMDYQGYGKASLPMLPSIGIPTTAGSGSEAQSYAVVVRAEDNVKIACGDIKARFQSVILDSSFLVSVPRDVQAAAGIDAISHALESFVCRTSTTRSRSFSRKSWEYLERSIEKSVLHGMPRSTEEMLLGSYLAGNAIEQSMLGAAHACANPLTARYGVRHGVAIGLVLPEVIRFNSESGDVRYDRIEITDTAKSNSGRIEGRIREIRMTLGLPTTLVQIGAERSKISELSRAAALQWTGRFNPIQVTEEIAESIYEGSFN